MLWFEQNLQGREVRIINCSDDLSVVAIAGPASRELMNVAASGDVSRESMPFMSVRSMDVGIVPCQVARLSFTGELGFEMYCPSAYAHSLYDHLFDIGAQFGIRPFGIRALVSMGMEKGFGIWSREFSPDYTPSMSGFDRFIDYEKADFIGREAALADRDATPEHQLVPMQIDAADADAWGYEPVWYGDELAGFTTSGAYGHTTGKSLALAYVKTPFLGSNGTGFSVNVADGQRPAVILAQAAYDPAGSKMRS